MNALLSSIVTVAAALGIWTAVSVVSAPVLVCAIRVQARANARRTSAGRRDAWMAAGSRR